MLVFTILFLSVSVHAHVEIGDGGTINLFELLRRLADLEERLRVQERINEEQCDIMRDLQLWTINISHFTEEKEHVHIFVDTESTMSANENNEKEGMHRNINNTTQPIDYKEGQSMNHVMLNSNRIHRRALEG
jgi:hypothetical protein